jgi:hypothetical protein
MLLSARELRVVQMMALIQREQGRVGAGDTCVLANKCAERVFETIGAPCVWWTPKSW